jgi:WD40 repeat protein
MFRVALGTFALLAIAASAAEPELVRLGSDRFRQARPVRAIAYSPDGKLLATADGDAVHVWDAADGRRLRTVRVAGRTATALGFANDGTVFAVTHDAQKTRLVRLGPAGERPKLDRITADGPATGRFSPDGRWLALVTADARELRVIDTATGEQVWADGPTAETISSLALRSDSEVVAVTRQKGTVRLRDVPTGKVRSEYQFPGGTLVSLVFSPDGQTLAGENRLPLPGHLVRFDADTGKVRWKFRTDGAPEVFFSPDASAVIFFGHAGYPGPDLWHWLDAGTGRPLGRHLDTGPGPAALRPDGKAVATGTTSGHVVQWDPKAGTRLVEASADPPGPVKNLRFSADGSRLTGAAGDLYEWDVATGRQKRLTNRLVGPAEQPEFSADGKWVLRTPIPGPLRILGFSATEIASGRKHPYLKVMPYEQAHFLEGGRLVIGDSAHLSVFDVGSGELVFRTAAGPGKQTVAAGGETVVRLAPAPDHLHVTRWELPKAEPAGEWDGRPADPAILNGAYEFRPAVSADGRTLAVSFLRTPVTDNGSAGSPQLYTAVFDVPTGRFLGGWFSTSGWPEVAFSPDRRSAASIDALRGVIVHELATGAERASTADRPVTAVCFSPDGRTVAIGTSPGPVALWDLIGKPIARWADVSAADLWAALATDDAKKAFAAIRHLRQHPAKAVGLLRERMTKETRPANWIAERIKTLDAPQFRDREKAMADLAGLDELPVAELQAALKAASPETRERLTTLLARADVMTPDRRRAIRTCEVLEGIGSAEAHDLLTAWAKGPTAATRSREAAESLERLKGRRPAG